MHAVPLQRKVVGVEARSHLVEGRKEEAAEQQRKVAVGEVARAMKIVGAIIEAGSVLA